MPDDTKIMKPIFVSLNIRIAYKKECSLSLGMKAPYCLFIAEYKVTSVLRTAKVQSQVRIYPLHKKKKLNM